MKKNLIILSLVALSTNAFAQSENFKGSCATAVAKQAVIDDFSYSVLATPDVNLTKPVPVTFESKIQVKSSVFTKNLESVVDTDVYNVVLVSKGYESEFVYHVSPENCDQIVEQLADQ